MQVIEGPGYEYVALFFGFYFYLKFHLQGVAMLISCILPLLRIPILLISHPGDNISAESAFSDCFFSCLLILRCVKCPQSPVPAFPPLSPFLCLMLQILCWITDVSSCGVALRAPCDDLGTREVMFAVPV